MTAKQRQQLSEAIGLIGAKYIEKADLYRVEGSKRSEQEDSGNEVCCDALPISTTDATEE